MPSRNVLFPSRTVARIINRQAHEIIERNRGVDSVTVFGIEKKGIAVADALVKAVAEATGQSLPVHHLNVVPYRDDVEQQESDLPIEEASLDITDRDVILVDDVLFTGRTVRAALDALIRYGRPRSIQLAVLIDRGHREYPIQATFTGRAIPTKYRERIEVVQQNDEFVVYLKN